MKKWILLMTIAGSLHGSAADNPGRRLVLCLDGTWNSTANERMRDDGTKVLRPTNTLKICRAVVPLADKMQITYYDIGVGSIAEYPGTSNRLLYKVDRLLGGAWGAGFEGNVEDALHFLVLNYETGDEVYIFGFSRGAATARAVTRFLDWNGGLPTKDDAYYVPLFFREYVQSKAAEGGSRKLFDSINTRHERENNPLIKPFRPVPVTYLGVWDTVMSLGSRFRATGSSTSTGTRSFHADRKPPAPVGHARQALAVDEKRFDFRPEVWTDVHPDQKMEQRWFSGVHSNIGGGLKTDGLANIALRWIVNGARAPHHGLVLDDTYLGNFPLVPKADLYESYTAKYKILDFIRFRYGKGRRPIVGLNADLDTTVVDRMRLRPEYRPDNVLQYLACQQDLARFGKLPDDVAREVEKRRGGCAAS
jgi:uncharacterized protein (DUF2235 family)